MDILVTPRDSVEPLTITRDLGLVYANGSKVERLVEELQDECRKLGGNAVVRLRFNFEGRGLASGAAVLAE